MITTIQKGLIILGLGVCSIIHAADAQAVQNTPTLQTLNAESVETVHRTLRNLYFKQGQKQQAFQLTNDYLNIHPDNGDVRLVLALFYMDQKQYSQAVPQLNFILKEKPDYVEARINLINAELQLKHYDRAELLVEQGLALSPDNVGLKTARANVEAAKKALSAAVKPVIQAIEKPTPQAAEYQRLTQLYQSGQKQQAIEQAQTYLKQHPDDGDVHFVLAQFYMGQNEYGQARTHLEFVIKESPGYVEARLSLINLELREKRYKHAEILVQQGLAMTPKDKGLLKAKANIAYAQRPAPRPAVVTQAETRRNEYQHLRRLQKQGRYQKLIRDANHYLRQYPKDGDVRLVLGQTYAAMKQYDNAIFQYRRALADTPKYTDVRISLIYLLLERYKYKEAQDVLNQGLLIQPDNVSLQSLQGRIYFERGRYYQAAKAIKPIITRWPNNEIAKGVVADLNAMSPRFMIGPNTIGAYTNNLNASDLGQNWNYSTLFYGRDTDLGFISAKVNYNKRFGIDASQFEIDAWPVLNKYIYFNIDAAWANQPVLFPNYLIGGEVYLSLPQLLDLSFGGKFNHIIAYNEYYYYTGSLAKQLGNHWLVFRPYFFTPSAGSDSILYSGLYRYYIKGDPDNYFEIGGATGQSPDLNNLLDASFITIDNDFIYANYSFPLLSHTVVVVIGGSYNRQYYPFPGFTRNLAGGNIGIIKRF